MTAAPSAPRSIAVAVATRERPVGLSRLLRSLDECELPHGVEVEVLVVDNDPGGGARRTLDDLELGVAVRYVHEPRLGIPFARNRALDETGGFDLIAFVDDDEVVEPGWLVALYDTLVGYDADAATGPVAYELPDHTPEWVHRGGFFEPPDLADGELRSWAATNNVLVRRAALVERGLRFDETRPLFGGTDRWLFRDLASRGGTIRWSQQALVREIVPANRTTARWLARRSFRVGIGLAMEQRRTEGLAGAARVSLRAAGGQCRYAVRRLLLTRREGRASAVHALRALAQAVGRVCGLFGISFAEYRHVDGE
ncbi:MAG: glycosyltransferase family A protein [Acidimicrobiales bacterium]|nr:glycosyltransferase family A protein [Acidimicrobiales bacterium]